MASINGRQFTSSTGLLTCPRRKAGGNSEFCQNLSELDVVSLVGSLALAASRGSSDQYAERSYRSFDDPTSRLHLRTVRRQRLNSNDVADDTLAWIMQQGIEQSNRPKGNICSAAITT